MSLSERYVDAGKISAAVLWTATAFLMGAAWLFLLLHPQGWLFAGMLAMTSSVVATVAAVFQIRTYMVRLCSLVRVTSGLNRRDADEPLKSVR